MRIRAPPVIYLKTDEKLNTGRFILRTLPLLYLKHLIFKYGGGFFCFRPKRADNRRHFSEYRGGLFYGIFCERD